jgi:hypothetical protein
MKTIHYQQHSLCAAFALFSAWLLAPAPGLGQGTIQFGNRFTSTQITHVYDERSYPNSPQFGNTSTDTPAGTTVYFGPLLTGSGWTAQLWSAPGITTDPGLLVPAFNGTSTFRTGAAAGNWVTTTATLNNVPKDAAVATFQVRVFESAYGSWQQALLFGGGVGWSPLFQVNDIGGDFNAAPILTGLTSFTIPFIPEPSSLSLVGLAAAYCWAYRQRRWQN